MDSRVEDVMTRDVVAVRETAGYKEIIAVMRRSRVSAVPVLDEEGRLTGVVSEADLLLKEVGAEALSGYLISTGRRGELAKAAGVTAAGLMSTPAVTIGPAETVVAAARRMHDRRVKRLPVVDESGRLVGIVSRVDVLSVYARADEEIRDEVIRKIIAGGSGLDPAAFAVKVSSGIVTIGGHAASRAVAQQLADAVRHLEGVVDLRDRITFPRDEPETGGTLPPG